MSDLLLLGATGTTGRVAAAHLSQYAEGIGWTVAGRDSGRLMDVVRELPGPSTPVARRLDVTDVDAVDEAVAAHRVVLNGAGPYTHLAPPIVAACARHGVDYVDLSGELAFVADCIAAHDAAARRSGARLVQVCGFEALPFDLLVRQAAARAREADDVLAEVGLVFTADLGSAPSQLVSRGTFESALQILVGEGSARLTDVALLLPASADAATVRRAAHRPGRPWMSAEHGAVAPLVPSPLINPLVILRSAALLGPEAGYAPDLRYREGVGLGGVVPRQLRPLAAGIAAAAQLSVGLLVRAPRPVRQAAAAALTPLRPRGGPDPEDGADFRWSISLEGRTRGGRPLRGRLDARGNPGYGTTGRTFAEVGLAFVEEEPTLPDAAGHLTPAAALGVAGPVLDRLARGQLRLTADAAQG